LCLKAAVQGQVDSERLLEEEEDQIPTRGPGKDQRGRRIGRNSKQDLAKSAAGAVGKSEKPKNATQKGDVMSTNQASMHGEGDS